MKKHSTPFKLSAIALCAMLLGNSAKAQTIYGTISNSVLASFSASTPGTIASTVGISGITAGQTIEGLDFRPNTGQLYAFGYNSSTTSYQIYTIDRMSGMAMAINTATTLPLGAGPIGFDFNPTVDRIRVVSANGANYRLHPGTGLLAATDGTLNYATGDIHVGAVPHIVTAGYTNSYIGAATTSLYNYDNTLNKVTLQNPPNNGSLTTVGASGIISNTVTPMVDMDIFYDNMAGMNKAYLLANSAATPATDELYALNLTTGAATLIGAIGATNPVSNIAVMIDRTTPTLSGQLAYGLSGTNLISFDTQNPSYIRNINTITGITTGQTIIGMDFRPANAMLYALGYNATTNDAQLYTINTTSAIASPVNTTPTALTLGTVSTGFDFNPTVDRIRLVSNNDMNYRLEPSTGTISATDASVNFAVGDPNSGANPNVGTVAYINSVNTATSTTLYNYDEVLNILTTQTPPNNGTLNTIGASGITINPADPTVDMDIYYDNATMTNKAFLAANIGTDLNDNLYMVNLTTGVTTLIGKIGFGIPVRDIAIQTYTLSIPTGLSDNQTKASALSMVYPNPFSDKLIVKTDNAATITITNLLGQTIFSDNIENTKTINTSLFPTGIYYVEVTGLERTVIKLVKQ